MCKRVVEAREGKGYSMIEYSTLILSYTGSFCTCQVTWRKESNRRHRDRCCWLTDSFVSGLLVNSKHSSSWTLVEFLITLQAVLDNGSCTWEEIHRIILVCYNISEFQEERVDTRTYVIDPMYGTELQIQSFPTHTQLTFKESTGGEN